MPDFQPLDDTWHWREFPVLREAVRGADEDPYLGIRFDAVAEATGLELMDVVRAAKALEDEGLIEAHRYIGPGASNRFVRVAGEARRRVGSWPTQETALDRIITALEAIAANTDEDDDTRTRARKILEGLAGTGRQIGIAVAGAAITGQIPGAS